MSVLASLKAATSISTLAPLLGFSAAGLSYIIYKKDPASKYASFSIPKRGGGVRHIRAPSDDLKLLQRNLSVLLQACVNEINTTKGLRDSLSHGFKKGHSIVTNAKTHRNRRYVFNVDLHDFFGTINFGRVRGFFLNDRDFALNERVATVLAQIACHENALPQGSPCSPVVSNLIGHILDVHLVKLASRTGCRYTRYVDDLTFSTNKKDFPKSIAVRAGGLGHKWTAGKELSTIVAKSGFTMNPSKVRMQYRDSRQEVTGLIVNRKVNVRREYRHVIRALVHRLVTTGRYELDSIDVGPLGEALVTKVDGTHQQLRGMLAFVNSIDRYNASLSSEAINATKETTYKRFLLYSEMYGAERPVVICEGPTDNVYLVHAIRGMAVKYPSLASTTADGTIKLNVRLFKYSRTPSGQSQILGIKGGSSHLARLIRTYWMESKRFTAPGKSHPVVVLVDNDGGAKDVFKVVESISGAKPTGLEPFVHATQNLYVLPTPKGPGGAPSNIEDCFDAKTKSTVVAGKTFHPGKGADIALHYGKVVFAHKVIAAHASSVDFSGFQPILDTFVEIIADHAKRFPLTSPGS